MVCVSRSLLFDCWAHHYLQPLPSVDSILLRGLAVYGDVYSMYVTVLEVRSGLQSMLVLINHLACFVNVYVPLLLLDLRTLFLFELDNVLCPCPYGLWEPNCTIV